MSKSDSEGPIERVIDQVKAAKLEAFLLVCGIIFLLVGVVFIFYQNNDASDNSIQILSEGNEDETGELLVVDISGAVKEPQVTRLPANSRISDAILKAGGLAQDADLEFVSKNLNLAAKVTDGAKIYIPAKGEVQAITDTSSTTVSGKVNVNTANSSQLEALAGIGPVTASKIINNRPYSSVEELISKKVLGASTFEKLKDQLTAF